MAGKKVVHIAPRPVQSLVSLKTLGAAPELERVAYQGHPGRSKGQWVSKERGTQGWAVQCGTEVEASGTELGKVVVLDWRGLGGWGVCAEGILKG
jgi:hypothetical protein